jgi:hypothetical protein
MVSFNESSLRSQGRPEVWCLRTIHDAQLRIGNDEKTAESLLTLPGF